MTSKYDVGEEMEKNAFQLLSGLVHGGIAQKEKNTSLLARALARLIPGFWSFDAKLKLTLSLIAQQQEEIPSYPRW